MSFNTTLHHMKHKRWFSKRMHLAINVVVQVLRMLRQQTKENSTNTMCKIGPQSYQLVFYFNVNPILLIHLDWLICNFTVEAATQINVNAMQILGMHEYDLKKKMKTKHIVVKEVKYNMQETKHKTGKLKK